MKALIILTLTAVLSLTPYRGFIEGADKQVAAPQQNAPKSGQLTMGKNQEIQNIKPKKPVKIKLHRSANNEYTWDITGENPDEICRADSRLRKLLKIE
jgi:hypothetical protein